MAKLLVTMSDIQRYKVLMEAMEGRLLLRDAERILGISYRQVLRLRDRLRKGGFEEILRKVRLQAPNKKVSSELIDEILKLRMEIYYDFNIMHFKDKLRDEHNINLSHETIRQLLIKADLHKRKKKKKKVYRRRRRMPKAGMLIQMDSSQHRWIEDISEKWWLIATIDDASSEIAYAKFYPSDSTFGNMDVIRRIIEIKGLFSALYVDKASHFTTTRHGGLHYSVDGEQGDTQIERALEELGIKLITANSPQAKGRIEVTFRLFQDRLIKELRVAKIKTYEEANKYLLEKFLPWYNNRYCRQVESLYMPLPKETNLDLVFCTKEYRRVNNDNTISFKGEIIQILPFQGKLSLARAKVEVCLLEDRRVFVLYENNIIWQGILSKDNKAIKKGEKIEELLSKREYLPEIKIIKRKTRHVKKPSPDHPWRKSFKKQQLLHGQKGKEQAINAK